MRGSDQPVGLWVTTIPTHTVMSSSPAEFQSPEKSTNEKYAAEDEGVVALNTLGGHGANGGVPAF